MKIVIINGSARRGNTLTAIDAFVKGASEKNEIEIIQPDRLHIAPCKGCGACQCYKGCIDQDDTNPTIDKITAADVILFATPVYWWGMSAGVVDVVCSKSLPEGTKQLIRMLKKSVSREEIHPFSGVLYSQTDVVQSDPDRTLSPEEIAAMDWLADNVIGEIPTSDELLEAVRPTVLQQGIENKKG